MTGPPAASKRVSLIPASAIHRMTALSKTVEDVAFLSWAKPTTTAPAHIHESVVSRISKGEADGYSETMGLLSLREEICVKLKRDNRIDANPDRCLFGWDAVAPHCITQPVFKLAEEPVLVLRHVAATIDPRHFVPGLQSAGKRILGAVLRQEG